MIPFLFSLHNKFTHLLSKCNIFCVKFAKPQINLTHFRVKSVFKRLCFLLFTLLLDVLSMEVHPRGGFLPFFGVDLSLRVTSL